MAWAHRRVHERPHFSFTIYTIFLIILSAGTYGGLAGNREISSNDECALLTTCKESTKFGFKTGTTYFYNYDTLISTSANGDLSKKSDVQLKALAQITPITPCEFRLDLKNVRLQEGDSLIPQTVQLINELESNSVFFSWDDGRIELLCAEVNDSPLALNVKRGLLSMLQNSIEDFDNTDLESQEEDEIILTESDINGKCRTKYERTSSKSNDFEVIVRTKDLSKCSFRSTHISSIHSVPYASDSPTQSLPLLKSTSKCEQKLKNGNLVGVKCVETHKFQPFEKKESGAVTEIEQKLSLISTRVAGSFKKRGATVEKTLLFESEDIESAWETDYTPSLALLLKYEEEISPYVKSTSPPSLLLFVASLRKLSYSALRALYVRIKGIEGGGGGGGGEVFIKALPLVNTAPSILVMKELYGEGKMSEEEMRRTLNYLALVQRPRVEMIGAMEPLLIGEIKNEALLTLGSLIYSYCKNHENCETETEIKRPLRKILSLLGPSCHLNNSPQNALISAIFALKSIGNAGVLPNESDNKSLNLVANCYKNPKNPTEIRLASLDSFRRFECSKIDIKDILGIYGNFKEETEVRIQAYLMAMRCVNKEVLENVIQILAADTVNQVGSFVYTHLSNLGSSSDPDKASIRTLLSTSSFPSKFRADSRQFSRSFQRSFYWPEENLGSSLESNIIFTPDSFVPRSASLNLTASLFGQSLNLLEIGGRVHSFEHLLEEVFGPSGLFPETHFQEALTSVRAKRDTKSGHEDLNALFSTSSKSRGEVGGASVYARVFGTELAYKNFEFSFSKKSPSLVDERGSDWLDFSSILSNLANGKEGHMRRSSDILLDSWISVPTGVGFGLELGLQGASVWSIKTNGRFDVAKLWKDKELEISTYFSPSASLSIDGILAVNLGQNLKSGIKIASTLHTSTGFEGHFVVKGSSAISASFKFLGQKQEILGLNSALVPLSPSGKNNEIALKEDTMSHLTCTPDIISTLFGIKLCSEAEIGLENRLPLKLGIFMEKTEEFEGYEFDYKLAEDEGKREVSFLLDTPGSEINRRIAAYWLRDETNGKIEAQLQSAWFEMRGAGAYSKSAKNLQFRLKKGSDEILNLNGGLRIHPTRFEPYFSLSFYTKPLIELYGVGDIKDEKASFSLSIQHLTPSPISLSGEWTKNKEVYDASAALSSSYYSGSFLGQLRIGLNSMSSKAQISYEGTGTRRQTYSLSSKYQKIDKNGLIKHLAALSFTNGDNPSEPYELNGELASNLAYCETFLKLSLPHSNTYEIKTTYKRLLKRSHSDIQLSAYFTAPAHNIQYGAEFKNMVSDTGLLVKLRAELDEERRVQGDLNYFTSKGKLVEKVVNASIGWLQVEHSLTGRIIEEVAGEYSGILVLKPFNSAPITTRALFTDFSNRRKMDYSFSLKAQELWGLVSNFSLLISEKLSTVSTSVNYNAKSWGGSLELINLKKNSKKLEGRVFINDETYRAELGMRQLKAADSIFTMSLEGKTIFYSELQIRGYSRKTKTSSGSLLIIPDKTNAPLSKIYAEGYFQENSFNASVDYFGTKLKSNAQLTYQNLYFESEWNLNESQKFDRFILKLDYPYISSTNTQIKASLQLPIENYSLISGELDHFVTKDNLRWKLSGYLEDFNFEGRVESGKSFENFKMGLQMTGFEDLKILVSKTEEGGKIIYRASGQKGVKKSEVSLESEEKYRGGNMRLNFTGCSYLPQFELTVGSYKTSEQTHFGSLNLYSKSGYKNIYDARISYSPSKISFKLSSPHEKYTHYEGSLSINQNNHESQLNFYINGPHISYFPLNLQITTGGSFLNDFSTQITCNWASSKYGETNKFNLELSGKIGNFFSSEISTRIQIPSGGKYMLNYGGENEKIEVLLRGPEFHHNLGLNFKSYTNVKLWYQNGIKFKYIYEIGHENSRGVYLFKILGGDVSNSATMSKFELNLNYDEFIKWNGTLLLDSPFKFMPYLKLLTFHEMSNDLNVKNILEIEVKRLFLVQEDMRVTNEIRYQDRKNLEWKLLTNGVEIFNFGGILELNSQKMIFNLGSTSHLKTKIIGEVGWENPHKILFQIKNEKSGEIYTDFVGSFRSDESLVSCNFKFKCPFGHKFEGDAHFDMNENSAIIKFSETEKNLMQFEMSALAQLPNGHFKLSSLSNLDFLLPKSFLIESEIKFEPSSISSTGSYAKNDYKFSYDSNLSYEPGDMGLKIHAKGLNEFSAIFTLSDELKLDGAMFLDSIKIFDIQGSYGLESDKYKFGKHSIFFRINNWAEYKIILGVDSGQFLMELMSPHQGFKNLKLDSVFNLSDKSKIVSVTYENENVILYSFIVNYEKIGKIELGLRTPFTKKYEILLNYSVKNPEKSGKFSLGIENEKIVQSSFVYKPKSGLNFKLTTSFELVSEFKIDSTWTLGEKNKKMSSVVTLNQTPVQFDANWTLEPDFGKFLIEFNRELSANPFYIEMDYQLSDNYLMNIYFPNLLSNGREKLKIDAKINFGPKDVSILINTPFEMVKILKGTGSYELSENFAHILTTEWTINENGFKIEAQFSDKIGQIQFQRILENNVKNYREQSGVVSYNFKNPAQFITLNFTDEASNFFLISNLNVNYENFEIKYNLGLKSQFSGFENFKIDSSYSNNDEKHEVMLSLFKNVDLFQTSVYFSSLDTKIEAGGSLKIAQSSNYKFDTALNFGQINTANFNLVLNEKTYTASGKWALNSPKISIECRSNFLSFSRIFLFVDYSDMRNLVASLRLNEHELNFGGRLILNGLQETHFLLQVQTPFSGFKKSLLEFSFNSLTKGRSLGFIVFQNDLYKYMGKFESFVANENETQVRVVINTPIAKVEKLEGFLKVSGAGVEVKLERNNREEVHGFFTLEKNEMILGLISNLPQYPLQSRSLATWASGFSLESNVYFPSFNLSAHVNGIREGGVILNAYRAQWELSGSMSDGSGKLLYVLPSLGSSSVRSSWRAPDSNSLQAELWWDSDKNPTLAPSPPSGFSALYSLSSRPGGRELRGNLTYSLGKEMQYLSLSSVMRSRDPVVVLEFNVGSEVRRQRMRELGDNIMLASSSSIEIDLTNFHPQIVISLPWITYTLKGSLQLPSVSRSGKIGMSFNEAFEDEVMDPYEAYLTLPSLDIFSLSMKEEAEAELSATIPYFDIKNFKIQLKMLLDLMNEKRAHFSTIYNYSNETIDFTIQGGKNFDETENSEILVLLKTPYLHFEKITMKILSVEQNFGSKNIFELRLPHWTKSFNIELDYGLNFNSLFDMEGEFKFSAPSSDMIPYFLAFKNKIAESSYEGAFKFEHGKTKLSFAPQGKMENGQISGKIESIYGEKFQIMSQFELSLTEKLLVFSETEYNFKKIFLLSLFSMRNDMGFAIGGKIFTPFEIIGTGSFSLRIFPLFPQQKLSFSKIFYNLDVGGGINYNGRKIFNVQVANNENKRKIEITNLFSATSLNVGFDGEEIAAEFIWDLENPAKNSIGINIETKKSPQLGFVVKTKLYGASRGILSLKINFLNERNMFRNGLTVYLNENQSPVFGYFINSVETVEKYQKIKKMRADFEVGERKIEAFVIFSDKKSKVSSTEFNFKWDVTRDPLKELGFKFTSQEESSLRNYKIKNSLTLMHSNLEHKELVFGTCFNFKSYGLQMLEFNYAPTPHALSNFSLIFSREKNEVYQLQISHPKTNLDFTANFKNLENSKSLCISHLNIHGNKKMVAMEMASDRKNGFFFDIHGGDAGNLAEFVQIELKKNLLTVKTPFFKSDSEHSSDFLKTILTGKWDKKFIFEAGFLSDKEILVRASRNTRGEILQDFYTGVLLNKTDGISGHLHWRAASFFELKKTILREVPKLSSWIFFEKLPEILQEVNEEVEERLGVIDPSLSKFLEDFEKFTAKEVRSAAEEIGQILRALKAIYINNEFYAKDIVDFAKSYLETGLNYINSYLDALIEFIKDFSSQLSKNTIILWNELCQFFRNFEENLMSLWTSAENTVRNYLEKSYVKIKDLVTSLKKLREMCRKIIGGNYDEVESRLKELQIVKLAQSLIRTYAEWMSEFPILSEYYGEAKKYFFENIWAPFELVYRPYLSGLSSVISNRNFELLFEIPPLPYISYITSQTLSLVDRVWKLVEAEQRLKSLFRSVLQKTTHLIGRHLPTPSFIFDISKGDIEVHQPLTFLQWDSLKIAPSFKNSAQDQKDIHSINEFYFDVVDAIRTSMPLFEMNLRQILPPFSQTALIVSFENLVSFDGKLINLGQRELCGSYVLVTDLLHQNLTLLVEYEREKSYRLVLGDNRALRINGESLRVSIDGRKSELPIEIGSTFIRSQPGGIEIVDKRGFIMKCSRRSQICTLTVSGWYFGKLGGLLGNYDNEVENDLMRPDGTLVESETEFINSWKIGTKKSSCPKPKKPSTKNTKNVYSNTSKNDSNNELCDKFMSGLSSPLRPCFNTVDSKPYLEMCKLDAGSGENSCRAIGAYVSMCGRKGVDIWTPPHCIECNLPDGSKIQSGEELIYSNATIFPPNSSDIIFIIEESIALQDYKLNEIFTKLQSALYDNGIFNSQFSIVGYGGKNLFSTPHLRTSDGQNWGAKIIAPPPGVFTGDEKTDFFEALNYAAGLGFRGGVGKIIVGVIGDLKTGCENGDKYADALTLLLENDIRLQLLTPEDFKMKVDKKESEGSRILGLDLKNAFTSRDAKRGSGPTGDEILRKHVKIPKDFCTPLALETDGAVFNIKNLKFPSISKKFLEVWSKRVASSSSPSACQRCECLPTRDGGPGVQCHQCISPSFQKFMEDLKEFEIRDDAEYI